MIDNGYVNALDSLVNWFDSPDKYPKNNDVRVLESIDKYIGQQIPVDFEISDSKLNHLQEIKTRLCKISNNKESFILQKEVGKKISNAIECISLIDQYHGSSNEYEKISLKTKIRNRLRSEIITPKINWSEVKCDPFKHPEYLNFKKKYSSHIADLEINRLWRQVVNGVFYAKDRIENCLPYRKNPYFEDVAMSLAKKELLAPGKDTKAALWSGGYDVSIFAQKNGYATLENTVAGGIFDSLILCDTWKPIGQLWNNLSELYVNSIRGEVHVFFRVHDPLSVLERKEIVST